MMTAKGMAMRKAKSHETVESKPVPSKPYDRPNIEETKPSDNEEEKEVKPIEPKPGKASGKSEYNKLHLVALIIKVRFLHHLVSISEHELIIGFRSRLGESGFSCR
jgi:hypothetical protein